MLLMMLRIVLTDINSGGGGGILVQGALNNYITEVIIGEQNPFDGGFIGR